MSRRWALRIVLAAALLALLVFAAINRELFGAEAVGERLEAFGVWAPVVFVGSYAIATLAFLPGSVLTLLGGALFGPLLGTLYNLAGATLGATLAFLASRTIVGDWVRARAGKRLDRLLEGVEREGWRFVAFVRLVPLFPFNLLNYALGLTRLTLATYVVASVVFMAPGAFAYTYLGHAGRGALGGDQGAVTTVIIALAVLAGALFLPRLVRRWRGSRV